MTEFCVQAQLRDDEAVAAASIICNVPNSSHLGYCQVGDQVADIRCRHIRVNCLSFMLPGSACSFVSLANGVALVICENYTLVAFNETGILAQQSLGQVAQTSVKPVLTVDQTGAVATVIAHRNELLFFTVKLDDEETPQSAEFKQLQATRAMGASNIALLTGKQLSMDSKIGTNDLLWMVNNGVTSRLKVEEILLSEPVASRHRNVVGSLPLSSVPITIYPWSLQDTEGVVIVNKDSIALATLRDLLSGNGTFEQCPVPDLITHSILRSNGKTRLFVLSLAGLAEIVVDDAPGLELLHIADLPAEFSRLENTVKVDSMFVRINSEDELELSCFYDDLMASSVYDLVVNKGQVDVMFLKARPETSEKLIKMAKICYDPVSKEVAGFSSNLPRAMLLKFGELASAGSQASIALPGIKHASFLASKSLALLSDDVRTMCFKAGKPQDAFSLEQIIVPELNDCVVLASLSLETGDIIATNRGLKLCAKFGVVNTIKSVDAELVFAEASSTLLCCMTLEGNEVVLFNHELSCAKITVNSFPIFCRITNDNRVIIGCGDHKIYLYKVTEDLTIEAAGSRKFDSHIHDAFLFPNSNVLAVSFSRGTWAAIDWDNIESDTGLVESIRGPGKSAMRFYACPGLSDLFACSTGVYRIYKDSGLVLPLLSNEGSNKSLECSEIDLLFTMLVGNKPMLFAATHSQLVPLPFIPSERHDIGSTFYDLPIDRSKKGEIVSLHLVSRIRAWMITRQETLDFVDLRNRLPLTWSFSTGDELEAGIKIHDSFTWKFQHEGNHYEHVVLVLTSKSGYFEIRTYTIERTNTQLKLTRRLRRSLLSDEVYAVAPYGDKLAAYERGKFHILPVVSEDGKASLKIGPNSEPVFGQPSAGYSSAKMAVVGGRVFLNEGQTICEYGDLVETFLHKSYHGDYSLLTSGMLSGEPVLIVVERKYNLHVFRIDRDTKLACVFSLQVITPIVDVIQIGDRAGASSFMILDERGSLCTVVLVPKPDFLDDAFKLKLLI